MTSGTTANRGANSPGWYLAPLLPATLARCLSQRGLLVVVAEAATCWRHARCPERSKAGWAAFCAAPDASPGGERCREGA